jgi:hypothetical protein
MPGRFYLSLGRRCLSLAMMASLALLFGGCGKPDGKAKGGDEHDHHHHHAHPTVGPHKGTILEWGSNHEHHVELVIDRDKQQATVYFLDHDMKKTEPTALTNGEIRIIDAENSVQIPLVASPLDGETAEKSSRYVGTHAALGSKEPLTGDVRGQVGGINYLESFEKIGGAKAATPGDKKADGDKHEAHEGHEHDAHEKDAHEHEKHDEHADEKEKDAEKKDAAKRGAHADDASEHAKDEHAHDEHGDDAHAHDEHGKEGKASEPKKDSEQPKADAEKEHKHEEGHEHDHDAHDHDHEHEHGSDENKPAASAAPKG